MIMKNLVKFAETLETLRRIHGGEFTNHSYLHLKRDLSEVVIDNSLLPNRSESFDYIIPFSLSSSNKSHWICLGFYRSDYTPTKLLFKPKFFPEGLEITEVTRQDFSNGDFDISFKIRSIDEQISIRYRQISHSFWDNLSEEIKQAIDEHILKSNSAK
jgi:hypothetical protein